MKCPNKECKGLEIPDFPSYLPSKAPSSKGVGIRTDCLTCGIPLVVSNGESYSLDEWYMGGNWIKDLKRNVK